MTARIRRRTLGAEDARRATAEMSREIRQARRTAGVSQALVAARAGVSRAHVGRLERNQIAHPSLDILCRCARAVGLAISLRAYPDGTRLIDQPALRLLGRLEAVLSQPLRLRREVGLPIAADLRAWDGRIIDEGRRTASIEAEARLLDVQALVRRIELKARDDPEAGVVILLVNRTAHNSRVLAEHREALRARFPLDGAAILHCLRAGRVPPAWGILQL